MQKGFLLKSLLVVILQVQLLHYGLSCDIPSQWRSTRHNNLRWFYRYDTYETSDRMWLYRYKDDTYFQETDASGKIVYLCDDSYTSGNDFYMIRINSITQSTRTCEKLHQSEDGQALMRLREKLPSDSQANARQCEHIFDNTFPPQFLVKHTDNGFQISQGTCGLELGDYRAAFATSTGMYRCLEDDTSLASITNTSIHINTCYEGEESYPLKYSELQCVSQVAGEVVDTNDNGRFMLFAEDVHQAGGGQKTTFYCARYKVNETCKYVEMSINTEQEKAECAIGASYSTAGGSSIALLLWDPDDPCGLHTEKPGSKVAPPTTTTERTATVIEDQIILHVAMMYSHKGTAPSAAVAKGIVNNIFEAAEVDREDSIRNVRFEDGLANQFALKFEIVGSIQTIDETERLISQYWKVSPTGQSNLMSINKTHSYKTWEGDDELCPKKTCQNNGTCVYSTQGDNWFCLCPEKYVRENNTYCEEVKEESSSKLNKETLIIVVVLVVALAGLVVLAVVLSLVLCRRKKKEEPLYNSPKDAYEEDSMYGTAKGTVTAFHSKSFVNDASVPDPVKPDLKPAETPDK